MIVSFSALSVFLSKHAGPARDLEKLRNVGDHETMLKASLLVHSHQFDEVPCPDTDQDGDEDACSGGATSSGTLPWTTLGISRNEAIDAYGTYYTYVVADAAKEFCVSVPNDYDGAADPEFTGDTVPFDGLQVVATTAGATGTSVPFAVISHGKNRLGGISSSNAPLSEPPVGSNELVNATANPTTIYTGPYDSDTDTYFDDTVWAPVTSDLADVCEQKTQGGALNAALTEDFSGADGDIDQDKFETTNGGTEVQQEGGQAVFSDATAYLTTAASYVLNSTERPLYISAEWTPDFGATNGGFSIVTRAEATPSAGVFDPGITFRFFDGTGASGANSISIMDNGAQVASFVSADNSFTMTFGETYLLEVYDNGDEVWMQITQKSLTSNRASAYATNITGDTTGTRTAFVNGTASESRLDTIVVGGPMMAMDTLGVGHAQASGNGENGTTTGSITLEGWFKPRSLPTGANTATLISQWDSAQLTRSSHRLYMTSGGALSLSLGDGTATTDTEALGASLSAGEWTHVAVTYDDETTFGAITVYIDGALISTITGTASSPILSGNAIRTAQEQFMVGADHAGVNAADATGNFSQNTFDGLVSDIRVWDDVRTATEISDWYDRRLPIVDASTILDNLVVNWRFDLESGGFAATQVEDRPATIGADGDLLRGSVWAGALLNIHRTVSTDVCDGFRVGAFRCDFRDVVSGLTVTGEDLAGLVTFYAKAWGGGGGADTAGGASPPNDGGGGGYAGGLFLNTGGNLTITVGAGGASGAAGVNGADSFLDQDAQRVTGNNGVRGTNAGDGNSGIGATTGTLVTSVVDPTVAGANRRPGCVPAIAVVGNPCTDEHYTTTGAPIAEPGYGADGPLADHATGQTGAVILFW
ncbi:MAG: LamG domain-containing protein [Rhodospirillaceae bacterium]|nr:LamG domain-containing protein [Rhodospirillaceae bacterium]